MHGSNMSEMYFGTRRWLRDYRPNIVVKVYSLKDDTLALD